MTPSIPMTSDEINQFFLILQNLNPHPKGELNYCDPFTLLVAVVLSAQATDKSVNKATPALFQIANTPEKMVAAGEEKVKDCIKSIGFYNTKSRNIIALSAKLIDQYAGKVPNHLEDLITLPGVGRKTANVVLNTAFGKPTMAVDTHVLRVSNRTGLAQGRTPEQVEKELLKRIPQPFLSHAHHWLILHGRYTCKARNPQCKVCPVSRFCHYVNKK